MRATRRHRLRPNLTRSPLPALGALRVDPATIAEDLPPGAAVGTVMGLRAGSVPEIVDDADGRFALSSGKVVRGSTALDYEIAASHRITLRETNAAYRNSPRDTELTIAVEDVAESAAPPADWRMPAAVTTDIAGAQASLAEAQAGADSKSRPSVTIAAGETRYVEWTVQESGDALLSWIATSSGASIAVALNGADQGYTAMGSENSKRQGLVLAVQAGDTIRLTVQAGSSSRTIYPLLHKKPASGPWDAHLIFGASREDSQNSRNYENSVIEAFPMRDPVIFNRAASGQRSGGLVSKAGEAAADHAGAVCYVALGSLNGNDISANRPYDSGQKTAMDGNLNAIIDAFAAFTIGMGNTSYRQYRTDPLVTPDDQTSGSLPYNDNVVHPIIAARLPEVYDASLERARIDEYLFTLFDRANLSDGVHSGGTGYTNVRALWADSWFRYVYTGEWGPSEVEQRVSAAETAAADGSTAAAAQAALDEAGFAMAALVASSGKAALADRVSAARAGTLYKVADEAVSAFEASKTQADKDAAQAAVGAAGAAGADVTGLQARIDAVTVDAGDARTVLIRCGNGGALPGWNNADEMADRTSANGPWIADLLDDQGGSTGWSYAYTPSSDAGNDRWGGVSTQSAGTSTIDWIPDEVTARALWNNTGPGARWKFTGLDDAKLYDIDLFARRTGGGGRNVQFTAYGANTVAPPQLDAGDNLSQAASAVGVRPSGGTIEMNAEFGEPNNSYNYLTAMRIRERGA